MTDKYKYISFFLKIIGSIFLGILIFFMVIGNSDDFKEMVQDKLTNSFAESFNCKVSCEIDSINFFSPKVTFDCIKMESFDGSWHWNSSCVEVEFSWLDLMLGGVVDVHIAVEHLLLDSIIIKNQLAVWKNLTHFFDDTSIAMPMILKSFVVKRADLLIKEKDIDFVSGLSFASITKNMSGNYKTKISFLDGDVSVYSKRLLNNISGFLGINIFQKAQNTYVYVDSKCTVDVQFLQENKTCFVTGKWAYDQGIFDIISQDQAFSIAPIKTYFLGDTLFAEFNAEGFLKDLASIAVSDVNDISGKCSAQLRTEFGSLNNSSSGAITLRDVCYKGLEIFSYGKLSFKKSKNKHKGFLSFTRKDGLMVNGDIDFDSKNNSITCNIINDTDIKIPFLPYWKVSYKKAKLTLNCDNFKSLNGTVSCFVKSDKLASHIDVFSDVKIEKDICSISGNINKNKYKLDLRFYPNIILKRFLYTDSSGQSLVCAKCLDSDENKFAGSVRFPFIKSLIKDYFDYEIEGEGDLRIYGMSKKDQFLFQLNFSNGSVGFPHFYNFLNNFKITFKLDPKNKTIIVKNSIINFHKGSVACKKSVLHCDSYFKPVYMHIPFIFNNCFVNIDNDLFALASGRMLFSKKKGSSPTINGLAIIEKSNLRRNIFSADKIKEYCQPTGSQFYNYLQNIDCDISIITKDPIRINTEFLTAMANIDLALKNRILEPQISGRVEFISGVLSFPYKNLDISKGAIYFLPHQSYDPIIELVAKNKISKYKIAMYVSGSFNNHNISFESSPILSQDQIMALLIAGSAQESLNVVAPALIMQTVRDSLFGSSQKEVGKKNYLEKFLKPFRKIRIVPSFIDQTGRGGLRGSLEVDINDRIRAFVQKNFSLSEDTRFEIEYLLSDDASIRAFRRENGDIGGEVEMRWKM